MSAFSRRRDRVIGYALCALLAASGIAHLIALICGDV